MPVRPLPPPPPLPTKLLGHRHCHRYRLVLTPVRPLTGKAFGPSSRPLHPKKIPPRADLAAGADVVVVADVHVEHELLLQRVEDRAAVLRLRLRSNGGDAIADGQKSWEFCGYPFNASIVWKHRIYTREPHPATAAVMSSFGNYMCATTFGDFNGIPLSQSFWGIPQIPCLQIQHCVCTLFIFLQYLVHFRKSLFTHQKCLLVPIHLGLLEGPLWSKMWGSF